MLTKTMSLFRVVFLFWLFLMLPSREIFSVILKVNYTDLENFVWFQNKAIRWINGLAFFTQLIQIPSWCQSWFLMSLSCIHFAQCVCVCICHRAISSVLRCGLLIPRLTFLSFFQAITLLFTIKKYDMRNNISVYLCM